MQGQDLELDSADIQLPKARQARAATQSATPAAAANGQQQDYAVNPFTVLIDSREQFPWSFRGIQTDRTAREPARPLIVPTEVVGLETGDYSIKGLEDRIAVERKSAVDLFGTLGGGRERFVRELERLAAIASHPLGGYACVIVEASWHYLLTQPPRDSKMSPKSVYRSILAWQQRPPFNRIHWMTLDTRDLAERFCFRCLERFWEDIEEQKRRAEREQRKKQKTIPSTER